MAQGKSIWKLERYYVDGESARSLKTQCIVLEVESTENKIADDIFPMWKYGTLYP